MRVEKIKCIKWDDIETDSLPPHCKCSFVSTVLTQQFCKSKYEYNIDKLEPLEKEMSLLSQAQKILKEAEKRLLFKVICNYLKNRCHFFKD